MTTRLTFPASMFSVVCQRCGSTMRKNADSCPNCGADRKAALGTQQREAGAAQQQASMFEQTASASASASAGASVSAGADSFDSDDRAEPSLRPGWPAWDAKRASERIAQKAAEYRARRAEAHARNAYADSSNDPDVLPGSGRWNVRKTVIAGACGLALAAGAAFYLQSGDSDRDIDADGAPSADHSVSGAIDSKIGPLVRGAIDTSNSPVAPGVTERRSAADTRTLAPGDALHGVRVAIDQHDLGTARARLKALPAQQQTRPEYESLKDELVKRELQRDAALQLARACERTSAWACVQQNAGEALALDGSNAESQAMLERVISHAGWLAPTASAALAKKVPQGAAGTATANANPSAPAQTNAANTTSRPIVAAPAQAPAQANVAVAPPAAKPNVVAQKPLDRRAAQRSAAARDAADEARAEADFNSRAEKLARGQAATNALTAATIQPQAAPSVATTMMTTPLPAAPAPTPRATPPASSQAQAQQQPQSVVKTSPPPAAQAPATHAQQPYYLGEDAPPAAAPGAHANANAQRPYYLGEDAPQPGAPAARANNTRPYYLGEDPPQPTAPAPPATRSAVPRPPQATGQSSSIQPSGTTTQAAVPRPPAASAQPVATVVTPRVPPILNQPATQANASTRSAQPQPVATPAASTQFGNMPAGSHLDSDKTEELERAIKQYGWSSGDSAPKPSQ